MFVAFCENPACGAIFQAPNIIGGSGSATIHMTGTRFGPCPRCGGFGHIPDGVYRYANQIVEFLRGPQESLDALRKIESLLKQIQSSSVTRSQVLENIRAVSPTIAKELDKTPQVAIVQQWIQILLAFITLAILVQTTYFKKTDKELETKFIVHLLQENNEFKRQQSIPAASKSIPHTSTKVPRNAPCPCGSGKKYKCCCGAST